MTAQVVTAEELIEYLTEIVDKHGDIPVIINSAFSGAIESIGRPMVQSVIPVKEVDGFQAYKYASQEDAPQTKAALIN